MAHGTGSLYGFRPTAEKPYAPQTGFWGKDKEGKNYGAFWEEGFAEYMRMKFLEDSGITLREGTLVDEAANLRIRQRYSINHEPIVLCDASLAGYAIERLTAQAKGLPEKLLLARKSSEGLGACIDFFESNWPRLYGEINKIQHDPQGFREGLRKILQLTT